MMSFGRLRYHVPRFRQLLGAKIRIGPKSYLANGYHADRLAYELDNELHLIPIFTRILTERSGAILDIGANCGQTLVKLLSIQPECKYFGFEPQVECCFFIERFRAKNDLRNVTIMPIALSDSNGSAQLFFDEPVDVTASLLPSRFDKVDELRPRSKWIPVRVGDEIVDELGIEDLAVIKVDVEGFELEVFKGLRSSIDKFHPVLIFEILTNRKWGVLFEDAVLREQNQIKADQIFEFLKSMSYDIYRIDDKGLEHYAERVDLDAKLGPHFSNDGRDYVAYHRKDRVSEPGA